MQCYGFVSRLRVHTTVCCQYPIMLRVQNTCTLLSVRVRVQNKCSFLLHCEFLWCSIHISQWIFPPSFTAQEKKKRRLLDKQENIWGKKNSEKGAGRSFLFQNLWDGNRGFSPKLRLKHLNPSFCSPPGVRDDLSTHRSQGSSNLPLNYGHY